ncbi:carboxypeptidase-like regulatory domain-containing protein [Niabella drilacis]|uniref:CarboxypepD_reg-like domain-containing protein n=1 Tax=Niabella drilacis (strain DSM 25811 / CCM 8410 / CCUG 62505 / LMG 26954 / E90) TaxID=1285928 RepID=A0A1G6SLV3_NIADE|nr:carboxypeptidase-like regulatory domain-containing protein [Niabella drilacis]SDD17839.1 CarboxypepD_reg-like domain-containing protein [Niabella drilacis]
MKKIIIPVIVLLFIIPSTANAQFEKARDSVIQLFGIVMSSDSLYGIPSVSVTVKGSSRGTITNEQGVFSIAVLKGDEIEFSHVSYKPILKAIPRNLEGNQYNIVVLMTEDTVYLPAAIIRPRPTPEQLARDFVNVKVADDELEIIRKNNTKEMQRAMLRKTAYDGREVTNMQLNMISQKARYQGQIPPMNIFNPAAWSEFIKSWKRGDYKRK